MPTYSLLSSIVANANDKNLVAINNATGSGKLIKIYRIRSWNSQTGTISGGFTGLKMGRISGVSSGGTALPFMPHSSCVSAGSNTPFTGISAVDGATTITATLATEFRRVFRATEEWAVAEATVEAIQNVHQWQIIWDTGYADSNVEPFIIRENQGFLIRTDSTPANAAGGFRFHIELTII